MELKGECEVIKIYCEECNGNHRIRYHWTTECENCGGKGYTEHGGSIDDLQLSAALEWSNEVHLTDWNYKNILERYKSREGDKFINGRKRG